MSNVIEWKAEPVPFRGGNIMAMKMPDGDVWVDVRKTCGEIGIEYEPQRQKLRDPSRCPWATTSEMMVVAGDQKIREGIALQLDGFPMWLATVETGRIANESAKATLVAYQKEASRVLREHFFGRPTTKNADPILALIDALKVERERELADGASPANMARRIALIEAQLVGNKQVGGPTVRRERPAAPPGGGGRVQQKVLAALVEAGPAGMSCPELAGKVAEAAGSIRVTLNRFRAEGMADKLGTLWSLTDAWRREVRAVRS